MAGLSTTRAASGWAATSAARRRSACQRVERPVAAGKLERGLGVAAGGPVVERAISWRSPGSASRPGTPRRGGAGARRSSTRRRSCRRPRWPGRPPRPAGRAMARLFSASISAAARTRIRSSSSRVAAMSASRDSWARRWARSTISRASRRAAAISSAAFAARGFEGDPRRLGVLQPLVDHLPALAEHGC